MRNLVKAIFFLCFAFSASEGFSASHMIDSLQISFRRKVNLTGGFSTKNTFVNNFNAPVFTAKVGVDFGRRVRIGGGIASLQLPAFDSAAIQKPFYIRNYYFDTTGNYRVRPSALQFSYFTYYFEYVFHKTKRWEFSVPLQIGFGYSRYKYNDPVSKKDVYHNRALIVLYEPTVSCYYKVFSWFGLGADVGFRFMLKNNRQIGKGFNSPIYDLKAIIFWTDLYCAVFPNTKLAKHWSE